MILVDTSIVVDVLSGDPDWSEGSARALELCTAGDELSVNDIVFAELAAGYPTMEPLETALESLKLTFARMPKEALFLAGHAFRRYRRAGGTRSSVLADFFVGAHAAALGAAVLTRDSARIRSYFPSVRVIEPDAI